MSLYKNVACAGMDVHYKFSNVTFCDSAGKVVRRERLEHPDSDQFRERITRCPKGSFGTQSERGARYVERILTVCATCRLQERSVIEYLRDACRCHLEGIPSLIKPVGSLVKSA